MARGPIPNNMENDTILELIFFYIPLFFNLTKEKIPIQIEVILIINFIYKTFLKKYFTKKL